MRQQPAAGPSHKRRGESLNDVDDGGVDLCAESPFLDALAPG